MLMNLDFMHNYLLDLNKYHYIFMIVVMGCVIQMAPSFLVIYVMCNHICKKEKINKNLAHYI